MFITGIVAASLAVYVVVGAVLHGVAEHKDWWSYDTRGAISAFWPFTLMFIGVFTAIEAVCRRISIKVEDMLIAREAKAEQVRKR